MNHFGVCSEDGSCNSDCAGSEFGLKVGKKAIDNVLCVLKLVAAGSVAAAAAAFEMVVRF